MTPMASLCRPALAALVAPGLLTTADDLLALLRKLDASPAHLVGNSSGAYIALVFAMQHPEAVRSLVLGEPPCSRCSGARR
jgi:pimeloyl-ACP methyl ester carboxylesterase